MDVLEAIKTRRSIRSFTDKPVPEDLITIILDSARYAPSAGNIQPWELIIVKKQETKDLLSRAALGQGFIADAPVVIVVCADQRRSTMGYGDRGANLYCIQDTAACIQNMLLTAHSLGLGACWVGAFNEEAVRSILSIPSGVRPLAILPIGWPSRIPPMRNKRALHEILHYEKF